MPGDAVARFGEAFAQEPRQRVVHHQVENRGLGALNPGRAVLEQGDAFAERRGLPFAQLPDSFLDGDPVAVRQIDLEAARLREEIAVDLEDLLLEPADLVVGRCGAQHDGGADQLVDGVVEGEVL